jgi:hypothetical protein
MTNLAETHDANFLKHNTLEFLIKNKEEIC